MTRLTDEELAAIKVRLTYAIEERQLSGQVRTDIQSLLDELHELRARESALVEIARSVAAIPHVARGGRSLCVACGRDATNHRPDCFRAKARGLLGLAP